MNIMILQMEYIEALVSFKLMAHLQMISPSVSKDQVYDTHASFVRAKDAYQKALLAMERPQPAKNSEPIINGDKNVEENQQAN